MKTAITEDKEITLTLTEEESIDIKEGLVNLLSLVDYGDENESLLILWGELDWAINSKLEKARRNKR